MTQKEKNVVFETLAHIIDRLKFLEPYGSQHDLLVNWHSCKNGEEILQEDCGAKLHRKLMEQVKND